LAVIIYRDKSMFYLKETAALFLNRRGSDEVEKAEMKRAVLDRFAVTWTKSEAL
jgi:hypothetical protein